jgi:hypothetical protein
MPIRGSPNGARHPRPQAGRDRPEWKGRDQSERLVAINRNGWSRSPGSRALWAPATEMSLLSLGSSSELPWPWRLGPLSVRCFLGPSIYALLERSSPHTCIALPRAAIASVQCPKNSSHYSSIARRCFSLNGRLFSQCSLGCF